MHVHQGVDREPACCCHAARYSVHDPQPTAHRQAAWRQLRRLSKLCKKVLKMPARVCNTHVSAIPRIPRQRTKSVRELTDGVDDMRVLVRNMREMECRVSPTSHAAVLLMPTQKFIRQLLDTLDNACEPTAEFTMCAAKFQHNFIDNNLHSRDTITEALEVYESLRVLEALPTRWSPIHLFKCNCRSCFTHASCAHVLLASMCVTRRSKSHCNTSPQHLKFAVSVDAQRARASKGKREMQRRRHERRCMARGMKCQV